MVSTSSSNRRKADVMEISCTDMPTDLRCITYTTVYLDGITEGKRKVNPMTAGVLPLSRAFDKG